MNKISTSLFMIGASVFVLSACSGSAGPGKIGSVDDIVVKNNGLPSASAATAAPVEGQDFSSTVEQAQAIPAPDVAPAETLADASADTQETPPSDGASSDQGQPVTEEAPAPVADQSVVPAPAPVSESVAPTQPSPAAAPVATPVAEQPKPVVAPATNNKSVYPLDPNAPYSPKAVAAAEAAAAATNSEGVVSTATPAPAAISKIDMNDPAIIRSTQAALAAKALYTGPQTGIMDAALLNSITEYQAKNGLPQGGLNEPTLRSLGLIE